jgi:hypothetical protein
MVSKCANPICSASFRYLHEGKLFRMAVTAHAAGNSDVAAGSGPKKSSHHIEFFWLCEECAPAMTLTFEPGIGVTAEPLTRSQVATAS